MFGFLSSFLLFYFWFYFLSALRYVQKTQNSDDATKTDANDIFNGLVDLSHLKHKELDDLIDIFHFWKVNEKKPETEEQVKKNVPVKDQNEFDIVNLR